MGETRCPFCRDEGERSTVEIPTEFYVTLLPAYSYYDEDGAWHLHDPNGSASNWWCSRGHGWAETTYSRCPAGCETQETTVHITKQRETRSGIDTEGPS